MMIKKMLPIFLATAWISFSEFFRNEFLLKTLWVEHYKTLGLVFPSAPVNGAVWGLWSLCFAVSIFFIAQKFSFFRAVFFLWWMGFVLMWLSLGNLGVLPFEILWWAIPLSLLEVVVAVYIVKQK